MTVGELIIILRQFEKDTLVYTHEDEGRFNPLTKVTERWMREENEAIHQQYKVLPDKVKPAK